MPIPARHTLALALAAAALSALAGCSSSIEGTREFTVAPGDYARAFNATRTALRDLDFRLDRVDAAAGVITTDAHFSQGLLEPWDRTQTGLDQEWEDALNFQAREIRVTFAPREGEPPADMRLAGGEIVASVQAVVLRQHRAGRRLDSENVGSSSFYRDADLALRHGSRYTVPVRRDERLESRLAATIADALQDTQQAPTDD